MENKKPLAECRNEEERRENYPRLCYLADLIEVAPDPMKLIKVALYIIAQRRKEREAGQE